MKSDITTLHVTRTNQKRLFMLKRKGESYNDVISRLLKEAEKN